MNNVLTAVRRNVAPLLEGLRHLTSKTTLLFILLLSLSSVLAGARPLPQILSYREFTDLVKESVGKIPDLQAFWNWQRQTGNYVYFGGGTLRGLLHWLHTQLQDHSVEEVRKMRVPTINQLQLQAGSDIDLFAPDELVPVIKKTLPQYSTWDILPDTFHTGNVAIGGPTIEKIRVNPNYFDDPLGGLRHFYEGRLVFQWTPEEEFRQLYWVKERGNTKTTEALRFIRFTYNLPELTVDPGSVAAIKTISKIEIPLITKSEGNNWWLNKGVKKLLTATGNNLPETLDALRQYNLLNILATHAYIIPGKYLLADYVTALQRRNFSISEMKEASKMIDENVPQIIKFMDAALPLVTNAQDFINLAAYKVESPSAPYKNEVTRWVQANFDTFFKFNPTVAEVKILKAQYGATINFNIAIMDKKLPTVRDPDDFNALVAFEIEPNFQYRTSVAEWVNRNAKLFFAMKPNAAQIFTLMSQAGPPSVDLIIRLMNEGRPYLRSASDLLQVSQLISPEASPAYKTAVVKWLKDNTDLFFNLKPSPKDLNQFLKRTESSVEEIINLMNRELALVKTANDFVELFQFCVENPSDAYRVAMDSFVEKNADKFYSLGPLPQQAHAIYHQAIQSEKVKAEFIQAGSALSKTPGFYDGFNLPFFKKLAFKYGSSNEHSAQCRTGVEAVGGN